MYYVDPAASRQNWRLPPEMADVVVKDWQDWRSRGGFRRLSADTAGSRDGDTSP